MIIGCDAAGTLFWSIDASFAVHNDMYSHTGAILTFGRGAVFSLSNKQKVNLISSTVAEIIGVDDAMNFVMWVKIFFGTAGPQLTNQINHQEAGITTISVTAGQHQKHSQGKMCVALVLKIRRFDRGRLARIK